MILDQKGLARGGNFGNLVKGTPLVSVLARVVLTLLM